MAETIVNKVADSSLVILDLEEFYPKEEIIVFDLKEYLYMGLILKEKDFRQALQNIPREQYQNKNIALNCTADAVIPMWAYVLAASWFQPFAKAIIFGDRQTFISVQMVKSLSQVDGEDYKDKRVVIKGCGDMHIPEAAYVEITNKLRPYAKSIMYGEPCSTVPIYKRK
jgi:hypothetical protein